MTPPLKCNRGKFPGGGGVRVSLAALARNAIGAGVIPDVGAIAPEAAKLDVVAMLLLAVTEYEDEFRAKILRYFWLSFMVLGYRHVVGVPERVLDIALPGLIELGHSRNDRHHGS